MGDAVHAAARAGNGFRFSVFFVQHDFFRVGRDGQLKNQSVIFEPFSGQCAGKFRIFPPASQEIQQVRQLVDARSGAVTHTRNEVEKAEFPQMFE